MYTETHFLNFSFSQLNNPPCSEQHEKKSRPTNGKVGYRSSNSTSQDELTQTTNSHADKDDTNQQRQADGLEMLGNESCDKGQSDQLEGHDGHDVPGWQTGNGMIDQR